MISGELVKHPLHHVDYELTKLLSVHTTDLANHHKHSHELILSFLVIQNDNIISGIPCLT